MYLTKIFKHIWHIMRTALACSCVRIVLECIRKFNNLDAYIQNQNIFTFLPLLINWVYILQI